MVALGLREKHLDLKARRCAVSHKSENPRSATEIPPDQSILDEFAGWEIRSLVFRANRSSPFLKEQEEK